MYNNLTVTLEPGDVAVEPGGTVGSSLDPVGAVAGLAQAARFAPSRGEATALTMLMNGVDDPVDTGIVTDLGVGGINEDNFVVLHGGILVDPVGVKDAEVGELASDLLLSNGLKVTLELKVVNTLMLGLTPDHTTMVLTLAASSADSAANDDVTLLGLVAEAVGLVSTSGPIDFAGAVALAVLPGADAEEKAESVTLLVTPELFHVFVGSQIGRAHV